MTPDIYVHQQSHDGAFEIVIEPDVPLVAVSVHEVEPDVVTALPEAHVTLSLIGSVTGKIPGKLFQRLVRGSNAGGPEQAELIVAGEAFAYPQHGGNRLGVVVEGPQFRGTDAFYIIQVEVFVCREGHERTLPAAG